MSADPVAEPIVAWRVWRVDKPAALTLTPALLQTMEQRFERGENPFVGLFAPTLTGVGVHVPWERDVMKATCNHHVPPAEWGDHQPPVKDCGCGIWALKEKQDALVTIVQYGGASLGVSSGGYGAVQAASAVATTNLYSVGVTGSVGPVSSVFAYGQVQLWGRIFEHAKGYRAEYARPLTVYLINGADEDAQALATAYGCKAQATGMPGEIVEAQKQAREESARQFKKQAEQLMQMQQQFMQGFSTGKRRRKWSSW